MISNFKRFALVSLVCFFTASAFATQPGNNGGGNGGCGVGQQTNGCGSSTGGNATGGSASANAGAIGVGVGQGGAGGNSTAYGGSGGKGGEGGSANVIGSGNSSVKNDNAQSQSSSNASTNVNNNSATGGGGGNASAAGGNGAGNSTSVNFEGSTYKEAAQTAYAAPVYIQPFEDCRVYVSLGGSSRDGSASGGIPLGNSAACLRKINKLQMLATNKEFPGTYTKEDFLQADCSVEGMSAMQACKK